MTVRFRIRTPGGQELSFASRETFEDFVRAGDLSPDDLVYDRETGSWSPARSHPAVLEVQYEQEAAEARERPPPRPEARQREAKHPEATRSEAKRSEAKRGVRPDDEEKSPDVAVHEDVDLDLALTDEPSPEEAKRAIVERLEAGRQADVDAASSACDDLSGFTMEDGGSLGKMLQGAPPPRVPDPPAAPPRERPPARREQPRRRERAGLRETSESSGRTRAGVPERKGTLGRAIRVLLLLAVLGGMGYLGFALLQAGESGDPVEDPDVAEASVGPVGVGPPVEPVVAPLEEPVAAEPPSPSREPVIASTVTAVRERARERYLASTQQQLRGLQSIPEAWPGGRYLSLPSRYPGVVDVWQSYLTTIRQVRATDGDRYRAAYLAALDDAAIEGEARRTRLDAGMSAFAGTAPAREAHFDRVEALATAAIQSHDALLEAEGLILFDATANAASADGIGRGASGRDSESQLLLDQVLAVLEHALEAGGEGPGAGENARAWVWDGFFDAATPSSVARPPRGPEGSPYG